MSDEADDLIQKITDEVRSWDPNVVPGSEDYDAACLCLLLWIAESESWDAMQTGAAVALGIPGDRIPQLIANLRLGGALAEHGFHPGIDTALRGEDSGITLAMLANIATGRASYDRESDTFSLTPVGIAYIETELGIDIPKGDQS